MVYKKYIAEENEWMKNKEGIGRKKSLRPKIIAAALALTLIPLVSALAFTAKSSDELVIERIEKNEENVVNAIEGAIVETQEDGTYILDALIKHTTFSELENEETKSCGLSSNVVE